MTALYLFCLGIGGVLLAATFFGDADTPDHGVDLHGADLHWQQLFSIRNLTYFLFVFGAIGSGLALLQKGKTGVLELVIASISGLAVAAMVNGVFGYLRRTDSSEVASDSALVGQPARVTLPVGATGIGKIELSFGGQRVELLARPYGSAEGGDDKPAEIENGSEVVIVEMVGGMALITRAGSS